MDPLLHTGVKTAVIRVDSNQGTPPEATEDPNFGWQGYGLRFWDASGNLFLDYLEKKKNINSKHYIGQLVHLKDEIKNKRPHTQKKKILVHPDNAPCHKSTVTIAKLKELSFEFLPNSPYSSVLTPCDFHLFAGLKRMLAG